MIKILATPAAFGLVLALAACNPYNPADRAVGGAPVGVGTATGILTTPTPPPPPPRY